MAQAVRQQTYRMNVAEFLATDFGGDTQWELIDGEPYAQASPAPNHGRIQTKVGRYLDQRVDELNAARGTNCSVVTEAGIPTPLDPNYNFRQADMAVTCETVDPDDPFTRHPILIVEILSPGDEAKQRAKLHIYACLPSVQEILLIDSRSVRAEIYRRDAQGAWVAEAEIIERDEVLSLASISLTLPLAVFYASTDLR